MLIDGRKISQEVLNNLKKEIIQKNLKLRLAAVLVSSNPGIKKFVELKGEASRDIGVEFSLFEFPETISVDRLKKEVRKIVREDTNDGVLVELPLPKRINAQSVLDEIGLDKDVDVLSQEAQDKFFSNNSVILPPAVEAVRTVLEFHNFDMRDKKAAIFGHGLLVGKPVAHWLSQNEAEVFVIDENTENPQKYSLEADIIVSGVGQPELIGGDMVKEGVVAIDFGYSSRTKSRSRQSRESEGPRRGYFVRDENKEGKVVGDFKFDEVSKKASLITPVPGGIGPVVIASVLKNLVTLNG